MGLTKLNGDVLSVVDVETTGTIFGYHEIIQIAVVPLNNDLEPSEEYRHFYMNIGPKYPARQSKEARKKHGLNAFELSETYPGPERAADLIDEWFVNLGLPMGKRLIPLAHNWAFERGFLTHWLGLETFDAIFQWHPRDTMLLAASLNDLADWNGGDKPIQSLGLGAMCNLFGVELINAHDALADCLATAGLYKAILSTLG